MKDIKLKQNTIKLGSKDYLKDYLVSLGINAEDTDDFTVQPKQTNSGDPSVLFNIFKGIQLVKKMMDENKKFFIQVDSDVDGFTSAAIFYQFFKEAYPQAQITYGLHSGKEHGVEIDKIDKDADVIVIPDAGSLQFEEQEELAKQGKYVLVLDHHEINKMIDNDHVIVINNQWSGNSNNTLKDLSGAGVVFMFIKQFDETYANGFRFNKYMDLAALGIIADMMDTRNTVCNYLIYNGLANINNKILQELLVRSSFSISNVSHPNKIDIAFYVAPLINGLIRSGEQTEKEQFFEAMLNNNDTRLLTSTYRGKTRTETVYQQVVRFAANAKSRQDTMKKHSSEYINLKIMNEHLDNNRVVIVPLTVNEQEKVNPNITGLTAMELVKSYNKPVLVLRQNIDENKKVTYSGSGRSKPFDGFNSLLQLIISSKDAIYAEGHDNAFGASFSEEGLKNFIAYSNDKLKDIDFNKDFVEVDYWFKGSVIPQVLNDFAKCMYIYGNGIPQPKFAFTFTLDKQDFYIMGKDKDSIKFTCSGVDFVIFKQPKLVRQIEDGIKFNINCVGRSQINSFGGIDKIQVIVDSCDIESITPTTLLDLI